MRIATTSELHPEFLVPLLALLDDLRGSGIPLRLYETARTPFRQRELYQQGRSRPGQVVTRADAWQSFHQFGMAADLVFSIDGRWTWEEPEAGMWRRFGEMAGERGLTQLSFERPHVQPLGLTIRDLRDKEMCPWAAAQMRLWHEGREK